MPGRPPNASPSTSFWQAPVTGGPAPAPNRQNDDMRIHNPSFGTISIPATPAARPWAEHMSHKVRRGRPKAGLKRGGRPRPAKRGSLGLGECRGLRSNSPSWTRTSNLAVNSRSLYQLSYRGRRGSIALTGAIGKSSAGRRRAEEPLPLEYRLIEDHRPSRLGIFAGGGYPMVSAPGSAS